jgi:hypothetical protein
MTAVDHLCELKEEVWSNFDHVINRDIAEQLKSGEYWAAAPGWNFFAYVWFAEGQYHTEIWRYGAPVAVLSAETIDELKANVCSIYGDN